MLLKKDDKMMSENHKNFCIASNYIEHLFILASALTECVYISAFASLVGIHIGIRSSALVTIVWTITPGIKK